MRIVLLCGGVGGSKLVLGLHQEFPHDELVIIVNTGDDLVFHGLHVSPDLDTVMYTLAGLSNNSAGWGLESDTFNGLEMMRSYGQDVWFSIGDRDMATHVLRSDGLAQSRHLTEITGDLARRLGISRTILPMSNDRVATRVQTEEGWLDFQEYFVKRRYAVRPLAVEHVGVTAARLSNEVTEALIGADVIVAAPSNPVVSIGPILAIPTMLDAIRDAPAPTIAVSPFIGHRSITGPADALMEAVGAEPTAVGLAKMYETWLDTLIVHSDDSDRLREIEACGVRAVGTDTLMPDLASKRGLARFVIEAAA